MLLNKAANGKTSAKHFGNWHTIYTRRNRWSKNGVLNRVFEELQVQQIILIKIEAVSIDSTSIKGHPDSTGALKKTTLNLSENHEVAGQQKFIWLPQMTPRL